MYPSKVSCPCYACVLSHTSAVLVNHVPFPLSSHLETCNGVEFLISTSSLWAFSMDSGVTLCSANIWHCVLHVLICLWSGEWYLLWPTSYNITVPSSLTVKYMSVLWMLVFLHTLLASHFTTIWSPLSGFQLHHGACHECCHDYYCLCELLSAWERVSLVAWQPWRVVYVRRFTIIL